MLIVDFHSDFDCLCGQVIRLGLLFQSSWPEMAC